MIYNELRMRGYSVDVGVVPVAEKDWNGKVTRKQLEVDFVCNLGSSRYYIQSAYTLPDEVKRTPRNALNNKDVTKMVHNTHNTPVIIKYPLWRMTRQNPKAVYACVNLGEAWAPGEIGDRAICIDGDIGEVLTNLP